MCKILVFAGTTEGRKIAEFLNEQRVPAYVCVATEYGETLLPEGAYIHASHERLSQEQMEKQMNEMKPEVVIDATHPYAVEVTENIRSACKITGCSYIRLLRKTGVQKEETGVVYVSDVEEAVQYLEHTEGNIFVTTGSKELSKFTKLSDYKNRIFARVLSLAHVVQECEKLGFQGKHLICMQGPFSRELNQAMLRQLNCKYLVTKMSGVVGGYQEKLDAARATDCIPIVIGRPVKEEGISLMQCRKFLCEKFHLFPEQKISLVGIGTGNKKLLTVQAQETLQEAELLIGAKRMLEAVKGKNQDVWEEYRSDVIVEYIDHHPEYRKIAIVLSGDIGFYSGGKKLLEKLSHKNLQVVCGISSMVYFMSKIGVSWDDVFLTSAHGRESYLLEAVQTHKKVFSILGTSDGVAALCKKFLFYGMKDVRITVGEQLSYEKEKILTGTPEDFCDYQGDSLSVIYVENEQLDRRTVTHGISDEQFIRDKVPMTKEEIRTVSLAKLKLEEDSVCYDIGAGTGSVSVEMALRVTKGKVYSIEKKKIALETLEKNRRKFGTDHMRIVEGTAPDAMEGLEPPTHAFIGGSSGNMKEIMELLLKKNPKVRIVINCIAMETVAETLKCLKELPVKDTEVVQLTVARAKEIGSYHMMMGENPITIISCTGAGE